MTTVRITVEDVNDQIDLGYDRIALESSTSVSSGFSAVDTETLVEDTLFYEIEDAAGTSSTWYRYRFSDGVATHSSYSNPFQVSDLSGGVTRKEVRQFALVRYKAGRTFLLTSGGTSTSLPTTNTQVKTSLYATDRGIGGRIRVTTGNRANEGSFITGSSPSAGTITINPALSGSPASGDEVEWHWLVHDVNDWDEAINRAAGRYWYSDIVALTGIADQYEYPLDDITWLFNKNQITGLWYYPEDSGIRQPWYSTGKWWSLRQDAGVFVLTINTPVADGELLYLEGFRTVEPVYTDDSVFPDVVNKELLAALAYDEVLSMLQSPRGGTSESRKVYNAEQLRHQVELNRLLIRHRPRVKYALSPTSQPNRISVPWRAR